MERDMSVWFRPKHKSDAAGTTESQNQLTCRLSVVTSRYAKPIEDRIDRDFTARRNPEPGLFTQQDLLITVSDGADALFIKAPADRLDAVFFSEKVSANGKSYRQLFSRF